MNTTFQACGTSLNRCHSDHGIGNHDGNGSNNGDQAAHIDNEKSVRLINAGVVKSTSEQSFFNKNENDSVLQWMRRARKFQQGNYNSLGDRRWDIIKTESMLEKKIGFALYGISIDNCNSDTVFDYSDKQNKCINNIKNHIIALHKDTTNSDFEKGDIYIAFVFVHLYLKGKDSKDGVDVLFRIPKDRIPKEFDEDSSNHIFVDSNCRTYVGWDDYLDNNKLPKCYMCYPINGVYSAFNGSVKISYKESPACKISKTVLTGLDIASNALKLGATGISIAALAVPIAAPLVWGATASVVASGAYDISRNICKLIDIKTHSESLSLENRESRGAWLGIAASVAGVASVGSTAIAKNFVNGEKVISRGGAVTLRIINVSSVAISGLGVVNGLITVVMKYRDGTLSQRDVEQFTRACYFFLNAVVSYTLAERLIKDIALSDISDLFHVSKNCIYQFTKAAIEFKDSTLYNVLRNLVLGVQSQVMPDINLDNFEVTIHRVLILVNGLCGGIVSWTKFTWEMSELFESAWCKFKNVIIESTKELCRMFKTDDWKSCIIGKHGYKPFEYSSPDIAQHFCMTIRKTIAHFGLDGSNTEYMHAILALIDDFRTVSSANNTISFLNIVKYICECLQKEFDSIKESYNLHLDYANFNLPSSSDFSINHDLQADKNIFFEKVLNEFNLESALNEFPNSVYASVSAQGDNIPFLETKKSNHYIFSGPVGCNVLMEHQYFQKASDVTGTDLNFGNSVMFSKDGIAVIKPDNENNVEAITFYSTFEKNYVLGIVSVYKK